MQISYEDKARKLIEANSRFLHHYERYQNHLQSLKVLRDDERYQCRNDAEGQTISVSIAGRAAIPEGVHRQI